MPDTADVDADGTRLKTLRETARRTAAGWDDAAARAQHHPELSPLAWHLGHVFFVETYWLREVVCGDDRATAPWRDLFFPEFCAKGSRGGRLPPLADVLDWTRELEAGNDACWQRAATGGNGLVADGYLDAFLRQHYAQHLETMALVRLQWALANHDGPVDDNRLNAPAAPRTDAVSVAGAEIRVGSTDIRAYDNEQPAFSTRVPDLRIAAAPVTNAEWLGFMADDGYARRELWSDDGWRWRTAAGAAAPQHWRAHPDGGWFCPDPAEPLRPDAPVHGICAFEADAFACWAGARLPHEHEWEHAAAVGAIAFGSVWEWCANALFPYPGFRAFPYDGYSTPWFDGGHRVLRGAGRHTHPEVQRPTFRNFYPASHRHVYAGLRVVWQPGRTDRYTA